MPDITMCEGIGCWMRTVCYRYKAEPSEYQAYFDKPPVENGKCGYFMEDTEAYATDMVRQCFSGGQR